MGWRRHIHKSGVTRVESLWSRAGQTLAEAIRMKILIYPVCKHTILKAWQPLKQQVLDLFRLLPLCRLNDLIPGNPCEAGSGTRCRPCVDILPSTKRVLDTLMSTFTYRQRIFCIAVWSNSALTRQPERRVLKGFRPLTHPGMSSRP